MYRKIWSWLLKGLRGKVEMDTMNIWDKFRYWLINKIPLPKRGKW